MSDDSDSSLKLPMVAKPGEHLLRTAKVIRRGVGPPENLSSPLDVDERIPRGDWKSYRQPRRNRQARLT